MNKIASSLLGVLSTVIVGCNTNPSATVPETVKTNKSETTYVVTVGMETSRFAGSCPGAALDASRMTELFKNYTDNVTAFVSETATKEAVKKAIKEGIAKSELFIFYYSGHGGSSNFYDTGAEEVDGKDEYLCLYDTSMRDNEIWELIKNHKGRVWIMCDACHSATMWRTENPFSMSKYSNMLCATTHADGVLRMQCWSGCPDDTYSYGSKTGGRFTNALLRHFDGRKTYDAIWSDIENDILLKQYENVQRTKMGIDYGDFLIFQ